MKATERLLDAPRTTAEEESVDRWVDAGGGGPADTITPFDAALTTASGARYPGRAAPEPPEGVAGVAVLPVPFETDVDVVEPPAAVVVVVVAASSMTTV